MYIHTYIAIFFSFYCNIVTLVENLPPPSVYTHIILLASGQCLQLLYKSFTNLVYIQPLSPCFALCFWKYASHVSAMTLIKQQLRKSQHCHTSCHTAQTTKPQSLLQPFAFGVIIACCILPLLCLIVLITYLMRPSSCASSLNNYPPPGLRCICFCFIHMHAQRSMTNRLQRCNNTLPFVFFVYHSLQQHTRQITF